MKLYNAWSVCWTVLTLYGGHKMFQDRLCLWYVVLTLYYHHIWLVFSNLYQPEYAYLLDDAVNCQAWIKVYRNHCTGTRTHFYVSSYVDQDYLFVQMFSDKCYTNRHLYVPGFDDAVLTILVLKRRLRNADTCIS